MAEPRRATAWDPVVIVALIGLVGGGGTVAEGYLSARGSPTTEVMCANATSLLKDDKWASALDPNAVKALVDQAFATEQKCLKGVRGG